MGTNVLICLINIQIIKMKKMSYPIMYIVKNKKIKELSQYTWILTTLSINLLPNPKIIH